MIIFLGSCAVALISFATDWFLSCVTFVIMDMLILLSDYLLNHRF
jgi:hypothetical protein